MAETSLGRASLSVTADLSGFTTALDSASQKTNQLTATNDVFASAANKVTVATEQQTKALADLQEAAVQGAINLANNKQQILATKLATDALVQQDGATLILMQDQKKLEAEQAKLVTSNKALENSLLKNDQAFRNNTFEIQKNIQKQQLYELNQKNLLARMSVVDQESVKMTAIQKRLTTETDIAAKKMDLQARQMLIESGAAVKLAKELAALEEQEQELIAKEMALQNQFKKTSSAMEKAADVTGDAIAKQAKQEIKPSKVQKVSLGIKDYIGIGAAVTAFNKITDMVTGAISAVVKFGASVVDAGAKFQQVDIRLQALTGSKTLAKGLQDIMKSGPSASFEALAESATRLSALKFDAKSVEILTKQFNQLGIALGNPEKIMNLIVDKIGDMAADGMATFPALSKLAEEGIPVWAALSERLTRTTGNLVTVAQAQEMVKDGLVQVGEAAAAIGDAASMNGMAEMMKKNANSFYGVWSTVTNNLQVLFQKVGGFFVEGFSLVSLSDGIQKLFNSIGDKLEIIKPWFLKAGAFISSVFDILQKSVSEFFDSWIVNADKFDLETILSDAKAGAVEFSLVFVEASKSIVDGIKNIYSSMNDLLNLTKDLGNWFKQLGGVMNDQLTATSKFLIKIPEDPALKKFLEERKKLLEQKGLQNQNNLNPKADFNTDKMFNDTLAKLNEMKSKFTDQKAEKELNSILDEMFGKTERNADQAVNKLDEIGKAGKKAADDLNKLQDQLKIKREEPKLSEKFLAENLTALQIYEKEIVRLNQMLAEGAQGELAFAMGSAAAIKKLKEATGLSSELKFAGAITKGSEADFKATLDGMGQNLDVQQQIRETLEAARKLQEQQLEAQKEIAAAIKAMPKPAKPVNVIGG